MLRSAIFVAGAVMLGAGGPAAAEETVAPPSAVVHGHSVIHPASHLTVRVPRSATYVGSERFDLYGVADAEVQVFAEAGKDKRLTKLYWIQFESYWPSQPDKSYNYTGDRREQHWGTTVWMNGGPHSITGATRPGGDRAHVQAMLERAGYKIPAEMMTVRMVQLLDDPTGTGHGRHELMFIYAEDLASTGKTVAELTDAKGEAKASWEPIGKALDKRALNAFAVVRK